MYSCHSLDAQLIHLHTRVLSSSAPGPTKYFAVYRKGTPLTDLLVEHNFSGFTHLPSCRHSSRRTQALALIKFEGRTVVSSHMANVRRSYQLYWPDSQGTLSEDSTGSYFCCHIIPPVTFEQCSSDGKPTYKLQVVGESTDFELVRK